MKYKMALVHGSDTQALKLLAEKGFNFVLIGWYGHGTISEVKPHLHGMKDDLPVYFRKYPAVAKRRSIHFKKIDAEVQAGRRMVAEAKRLKMKAGIWMFAPALPWEALEVNRALAGTAPSADCAAFPPDREVKRFCIWTDEIAGMLKDCVEEILVNIPGCDSIMYTPGESMLGVTRCSMCEDKARWETLLRLRSIIKEGAGRADPNVEVITRMWQQEHPPGTYSRTVNRAKTLANPPESALKKQPLFDDPDHVYDPDREIPLFVNALKERESGAVLMRKLSWADAMLGQPLSPHIDAASGMVHQMVEISLEHCSRHLYGFIPCIASRMIAKYAGKAEAVQAVGVMTYPVEGDTDWSLNALNLDLLNALLRNPNLDRQLYADEWVARRYGDHVPGLAALLLATEEIWETVVTYNGVGTLCNFDLANRPGSYDLEAIKDETWIWRSAFPDGQERMSLDRENLAKAFKEWNAALTKAERAVVRVKKIATGLPPDRSEEALEFFELMEALVRQAVLLSKSAFLRWAVEEGTVEPSRQVSALLQNWNRKLCELIASDKRIAELHAKWSGGNASPWNHNDGEPDEARIVSAVLDS